jgi:N-acetylneuraminate synthase
MDSAFSLDPDEMALLVREARQAWQALGTIHYGPSRQEKPSLQFRRSI